MLNQKHQGHTSPKKSTRSTQSLSPANQNQVDHQYFELQKLVKFTPFRMAVTIKKAKPYQQES